MHRIVEVALVTIVTTTLMFFSGMTVATCLPMENLSNSTVSELYYWLIGDGRNFAFLVNEVY